MLLQLNGTEIPAARLQNLLGSLARGVEAAVAADSCQSFFFLFGMTRSELRQKESQTCNHCGGGGHKTNKSCELPTRLSGVRLALVRFRVDDDEPGDHQV